MTIQIVSNDKPSVSESSSAPAAENATAEAEKGAAPASQEPPSTSAPAEEAEQKESGASETQETEANEGSEPESESAESHESDAPKDDGQTEAKGPKKKSGFQKRVDKLTSRATSAEQERDYWKAEALRRQVEPKPDPKVEPAKQATAEGEPQPELFDDHKSYVKALAKWEAKQLLQEERQSQEKSRLQTEHSRQIQAYSDRAKAFAEKNPDFDEVIAEAGPVQLSPTVQSVILSSENGPEIAYEFAKNPAEATRISKLPPIQAALEMGKLQSRLASKASEAKKPEPKRVSSAPAPIATVGGGGKATGAPKSLDELAKTDIPAFIRERNKQEFERLKQLRRRV